MSIPKWNEKASLSIRGSLKYARTGCWLTNGFSGQSYAAARPGSASATRGRRRKARRTLHSFLAENARASSISAREGPDRLALLPARGRRRRPAAAQVRDPPAGARDRDARARAGRPSLDPPRRRPRPAEPGARPPRALRRPPPAPGRAG